MQYNGLSTWRAYLGIDVQREGSKRFSTAVLDNRTHLLVCKRRRNQCKYFRFWFRFRWVISTFLNFTGVRGVNSHLVKYENMKLVSFAKMTRAKKSRGFWCSSPLMWIVIMFVAINVPWASFLEMSFQCLFIQNLVYLLGLLKNTQSKKTQFAL